MALALVEGAVGCGTGEIRLAVLGSIQRQAPRKLRLILAISPAAEFSPTVLAFPRLPISPFGKEFSLG
jgi:hypothetical protein